MKGKLQSSFILLTLALVQGLLEPQGLDPRTVTHWDPHSRTITYESAAASVVNSSLVAWGLTIPDGAEGVPCDEGDECLDYGVAKVVLTYADTCETIQWTSSDLAELKDCLYLIGHWYGGGQQFNEPWPMEKNPRLESAFVTSDTLNDASLYGGVSEAFWVASSGIAARVDNTVPLFLSLPDTDEDGTADQMCFSAQNKAPFVAEDSSSLSLRYTLCYAEDVRQVYESSFPKYFPYPRDIPDEKMFTYPIWSTWAEYLTEVNDSRVLNLAQTIIDNGFNNSQFEIDDNWETCYGDATFNPERFPDPKGLVDTLHSMGYRVTLWIHPFINNDCESFEYASENGFFLKDENGETQLTSWWQGDTAGYIDFTNNLALTWWSLRLENLQAETGMDSFKFDAGETSWMPDNYTLNVASSYWPNAFTTSYVDTVSDFGTMIEVRVGHESQQEPIFVRMLDKFSDWSTDNGLQTMIPSLLHSGLIGYPFVLPDMVGGNAYSGRPSAELFVRWAQSNTFMPAIQFSLLPWNYDDESVDVTQISRDITELHASYAPLIIELARNATQGAGPIARPTWWLCPQNEDCLLADQQFLLGDDILVTPVVTEAATSKDVVFPPGTWMRSDTGTTFDGPSKTTLSDITIESNIFFTRVT